jgi:hypothetical protein
MPRLRRIDVRDYAADDADLGRGEVVERVTAAYQSALADSGLQGPASWVSVALFPLDGQSIETVSVLVHCDKPDGQEVITASLPSEAISAAAAEFAALVVEVLEAGFGRLAVARDWDAEILARAMDAARSSVHDLIGTASNTWRVIALGRGASAPEQAHEIAVCGGGPMNGVLSRKALKCRGGGDSHVPSLDQPRAQLS